MPRPLYMTDPKVINVLRSRSETHSYMEVATTNRDKLEEFHRILPDYEIVGKSLKIEEIQSLDPYKVARHKAIEAFKANGYNPIVVEETSLACSGLGGRPGTYIKDFSEDIEMRRMIAESWLQGRDRGAVAKVLIAVYDGSEVHIREGNTAGSIAESLRGLNGFGWDDMFVPQGESRTFAEMSAAEKDQYSMRRKALQALCAEPFELAKAVYMIPEPYQQELERVDYDALGDERALRFAFALESIEQDNPPNKVLQQNISQIVGATLGVAHNHEKCRTHLFQFLTWFYFCVTSVSHAKLDNVRLIRYW